MNKVFTNYSCYSELNSKIWVYFNISKLNFDKMQKL